ncbi:dihydropteroate synthase [Advenella kashmirensis]|nr:dihydropteroate synthase [Advenella kashmirensis]
MNHSTFICGRFELTLKRPLVMGIVNVTPDSFSDGSSHFSADEATQHALDLIAQGADMLDIGGESTRPGADAVSEEEELRRIIPVIRNLRDCGKPLSVDTFKPAVMQAALQAGADLINDIYALRMPGALDVVAAHPDCGVCLMHMQGEPKTMQTAPTYENVTDEVYRFLDERKQALISVGVSDSRICLDPGYGFGKTAQQNYQLLREQDRLSGLHSPLLIGLSRKSMIAAVTGRAPRERVAGSIAGALAAVNRGAAIIRVHDVAETADALKVWAAVEQGEINGS